MTTKTRSPKKADSSAQNKNEKEISPEIDYPRDRENIGIGHYAIRISAQAGSDVEISFDGGTWISCRYAAGHWWFDWNPGVKGTHAITVRARGAQDKWRLSKEVRFHVVDN